MAAAEAVALSAVRAYNIEVFFKYIQPCSPVTDKSVPAGDGWLHEPKLDGYRRQVAKHASTICLDNRRGYVIGASAWPF